MRLAEVPILASLKIRLLLCSIRNKEKKINDMVLNQKGNETAENMSIQDIN